LIVFFIMDVKNRNLVSKVVLNQKVSFKILFSPLILDQIKINSVTKLTLDLYRSNVIGNKQIKTYPADATLAIILLPLPLKSAAVVAHVIVVLGHVKAKSPHGATTGRVKQATMCMDHQYEITQ
jgi:hypothetical protein